MKPLNILIADDCDIKFGWTKDVVLKKLGGMKESAFTRTKKAQETIETVQANPHFDLGMIDYYFKKPEICAYQDTAPHVIQAIRKLEAEQGAARKRMLIVLNTSACGDRLVRCQEDALKAGADLAMCADPDYEVYPELFYRNVIKQMVEKLEA